MTGAMPTLLDPAPFASSPSIACLDGRVVILTATAYNPVAPGIDEGTTQEQITADLVVIDGGPMDFGGNPFKSRPHTLRVSSFPFESPGAYFYAANIVRELRLAIGAGSMVGRIGQGVPNNPRHNRPWNLYALPTAVGDRALIDEAARMGVSPGELAARNTAARAAIGAYFAAKAQGTFVNPRPVQIVGAASFSYTPPSPPHAHAVPAPPAPQATAPLAAPIIAAPPDGFDAAMWAALPEATRQQILATARPAHSPVAPPIGFPAEVWSTLSEAQRQQILATAPSTPPNPF